MQEHIRHLIESGLSEKEACVYVAALGSGPSSVLALARRAGTRRSSTYAVIEELIKKGLLRREEAGLKTKFVAESPEHLRDVMQQKMQKVQGIIPSLLDLYAHQGVERLIRVYEGVAAMRTISAQIARETRSGDIRYVIGGHVGWKDIDPEWQKQYFTWRSRIRLDARLLFQDSERASQHRALTYVPGQKIRVLPKATILDADILITPRRVVISKMTFPQSAIVIEDNDMIRTFTALFALLWDLGVE